MPSKEEISLEEILASTSDNLFPSELGRAPVNINSADCDGDTPLHVMVWRNHIEAVRLLVAAGANIDAIGDMGETPLHVAVRQGNAAIIEVLLGAGARIDIRSEFGDSPQEMASKKGGVVSRLFAPANRIPRRSN